MILSHHHPARYDRCIRLVVASRPLHFCARCSGQALGFLAGLVLWGLALRTLFPLALPMFQWPFALLPLPATIDWTRQSLGNGESTNLRRLWTGAFFGLGGADLLLLLVFRPWPYGAIGLGVLLTYIVAIVGVLSARGALRRIVDEHFPGIAT